MEQGKSILSIIIIRLLFVSSFFVDVLLFIRIYVLFKCVLFLVGWSDNYYLPDADTCFYR